MIEIMHDEAGNVTGYWDHSTGQWVSKEHMDRENNEAPSPLSQEQAQAADADDMQEPIQATVDYTDWTKDQLKRHLDDVGVTYPKSATRDELIALMQSEAT